jgi:putative phage-type endonuclease
MTPNWKILTAAPPGTPEWLEKHKGRIGSSDLATILGVNPHKSRVRLWGELTGHIPREDIGHLPHIRRGILLEPVVVSLFENETKKKATASPGLVQHPTLEMVAVTPDRLVDDGTAPLECKTVGLHKRRDWNQETPLHVQLQGQGQLWVLDLERVYFAAFCLDAEADSEDDEDDAEEAKTEDPLLLWQCLDRRDDLFEVMGNEVVKFWEDHVKTDIPPDPGSDLKAVKAIYPTHMTGIVKTISAEAELSWIRSAELASARTQAKKEQDAEKAKILLEIGDAEYAKTPGGIVLRARVEPRKGYVVEPCFPRVLRKVKAVGA